jgi:PTH1 family peptidyl-tRNA hydrolase
MNLSGESVEPLMRLLQLQPADILVIADDMDLPVGRLRLRETGGSGGHNGLKSLIQHLRTEDFPRLRIGVGRPSEAQRGAVVDHVLSKFGREELEPIAEAIHRAAEAVECVTREGLTAAMNRVNQR